MTLRRPTLSLLLASTLLLSGEESAAPRAWKNTDDSQTMQAAFISRDASTVSLLRDGKDTLTFDISKLHTEDQSYLDLHHPHLPEGQAVELLGNAYGPLSFGDTRKEVEAKLLKSSLVHTAVNQELLGRTGLNGIFETKEKIGALSCSLYFEWNELGGLNEVTLRTQALPEDRYDSDLKSTWSELITLLDELHGKSASQTPYPEMDGLADGRILSSHLWRTTEGHSVLLGTGQEQKNYSVCVRITTEKF